VILLSINIRHLQSVQNSRHKRAIVLSIRSRR
jgi:hypothetical protein